MKVLKLLFKPNEQTCAGNAFETKLSYVENLTDAEFFSINPLRESRKDLNVTEFRNFLFEMDNMPLEQQHTIIEASKVPLTSVVFSGSKSYHVIISLEQPLYAKPHTVEGVNAYKAAWKSIASYLATEWGISQKEFDTSCQNPSRFSRFPGHVRDNGNEQKQVSIGALWTSERLEEVLKKGPRISSQVVHNRSEHSAASEAEMIKFMPPELAARLKYPRSWAKGAAGNYPELLKLILWMIDSTGASQQIIESYLNKKVFPILIELGYPQHKLDKPIKDAFRMKGQQ